MSLEFYPQRTQFDPGEKELVMNLDAYSCYKERTGICSLDLEEGHVPEKRTANVGYAATSGYCRELYDSILRDGVSCPVYIEKNGCGHYNIADGQHRLCIAKKKGFDVPAYLSEWPEKCHFCIRLKDNIFYKIKALFVKQPRVGKYFVKK